MNVKKLKPFHESEFYKKKGNVYFWTNSSYGRPADTIVFWYLLTPTGRCSKYWETLRFNADVFGSSVKYEDFVMESNRKCLLKLPKGYSRSEPFLYSGKITY